MKKFGILSLAFLLTTGVAVAGESMMQNEKSVKEKTTQSTTNLQDKMDPSGAVRHESTTIEKQRQTTSDDMDANVTSSEKVEMEKKRSKTTTESGDVSIPESTQEYRQQSETHHHSSTEVEKK
jgi:hypothetical protein